MIDWHGEEDEIGFAGLRQCTYTRRLKTRYLNTATLVSLLKACAQQLEELYVFIASVGDGVEVIEAIRHHCKQLSALNIEKLVEVIDLVGHESYLALIRSYGSYLRNARTDVLGQEHLGAVVDTCKNLEVKEFWENEASVDWPRLRALGPLVTKLFFNAEVLHGDESCRALQPCSNLGELFLSRNTGGERLGVTDEMIANVFAPSRFLKLEDLNITEFRASNRNVALIASCTANWKSAMFHPFESDLEISMFQSIADSGRHLNDIGIDIFHFREADPGAEATLEWLSELLRMFRKCRKLFSFFSNVSKPSTASINSGNLLCSHELHHLNNHLNLRQTTTQQVIHTNDSLSAHQAEIKKLNSRCRTTLFPLAGGSVSIAF